MNIQQIKETCLYIHDLDKTESFYRGVLDLPVISKKPERHIFFRAGRSVLLCFLPEATRKETELPPHYAEGPAHLAFEVTTLEYQEWKIKIATAGVEILHEQIWKNRFYSFYFKDPDGHLLEIVEEGMWD